jgi:hypothetical protein
MMKIIGRFLFYLLVLGVILCTTACDDPDVAPSDENENPTPINNTTDLGNLKIGSNVEVANTTIGTQGGTVKVSQTNSPVNGMEIVVASGSFSSSQNFKITTAEIIENKLGANVNPITPLISISYGGGYSNGIMEIKIPIKLPSGHTALGFYYDPFTGKLEGIPVIALSSNSITLLTRHFMSASQLKSAELKAGVAEPNKANIIITSISESFLNSQPVIASGFKPGVDDWEFTNYGSYIATGGHCAGQNMAAMWYYFEKKPTSGSLFNKFSDNPKLWQDNARGYKFCSVIHKDLDWVGKVATFFDKYIDKNQELDKLKLLTIAGTMLVTGEPQGIGIYYQNGVRTDGTPSYAGHDLICYQVSVSGGKLYISDPNTPGTEQSISFTNNKFDPYLAKLNGNEPASPFPYVTYYAKTAYIEWDKIGKRYDELLNNTIGNVAPNAFPSYTIWVKDKILDFELKEGLNVSNDTLNTYVECPASITAVVKNGKRIISLQVYGTDGLVKSKQTVPGVQNWSLSTGNYVKLTPGPNKLGYLVIGWNSNVLFKNSTESIPLFIDFKWITVNYVLLSIISDQAEGQTSKEVKFTARSKGSAPQSAKYIWNFGDGTTEVTKTNDSIATHTFAKAGDFNVKVELYDNSNNTKVTEAVYVMKIKDVSTSKSFNFTLLKQNGSGNQRYTYQISGTVETKLPDQIISILADTDIRIRLKTESYKVTFQCAITKFEDDTFGKWTQTSPWSTEQWRKTYVGITDWKGTNGTYSQLQISSNGSGTITGAQIGYGGTTSENNIWGIYKYLSELSTGSSNEYTSPTVGFKFVIDN